MEQGKQTGQTGQTGKDDGKKKQKSRGMFIVYILLALLLIGLQFLIFVFGKSLFMLIFHGDDVSVSFVTKLRAAIVSIVALFFLFSIAVRLVPAIPEIIRKMKADDLRNLEKYNAFLGTCFSGDEKVRDRMIFVLEQIDRRQYSVANDVCLGLMEKCHAPEEQAVVFLCRMICMDEMGYTREAITYGEKAISLRKGYAPALLETAGLCIKLNKMSDAERYLLEVREMGRMELRVSRMLYQVYAARNRHTEALAEALRCERLDPDSLEACALVCRAAHKCGEKEIVDSRMQRCASGHYEGYASLKNEIWG